MSDGPTRVSPSSLATYATCPQKFLYDNVWDVETPERSRRYLDRGTAYHGAIEDVCRIVSSSDSTYEDAEIRQLARQAIEDRWRTETSRTEYASDAEYDYDRRITFEGVESYFADVGGEHARNSLDQEIWLECDYDGLHLHGRADNLVRTESGLKIIDYKGSLYDIVSSASHQKIEAHYQGEEYVPGLLKSVFQTAMYMEGIKQTNYFEEGMEVEFTFYGILWKKERTRNLDGIEVSVEGKARNVSWVYEMHRETIWKLVRENYEGIVEAIYRPEPWEQILENACDGCEYRSMCADYLGHEVAFGD